MLNTLRSRRTAVELLVSRDDAMEACAELRRKWEPAGAPFGLGEDVEPLLVVPRDEVPVDVAGFVHVDEVDLRNAEFQLERVAHRVHDVHEVLVLLAREEVKVAHRSLPHDHRVPPRDRIHREAGVHLRVLVDDGEF